MFLEPTRTALDLRFRLFRTPVRVHPTFWLFGAFLGYFWMQRAGEGYGILLLWIACMFLSLLVHEFGHIVLGRMCGRPGQIILYSFGGLAVTDQPLPSRGQRIAMFLAGPAAGLALYGLIWLVDVYALPRLGLQFFVQRPTLLTYIREGVAMLLWMNLVWNVLNLVPIWPLDGGQISREVFGGLIPGKGERLALGVSFLLAATCAGYALLAWRRHERLPYNIDPVFTAVFLGLMALDCFVEMRRLAREQRSDLEPEPPEDNGWGRY